MVGQLGLNASNFVKADYFKEFSKDIITAKTPWETKAKREGIALIFYGSNPRYNHIFHESAMYGVFR